MNAAEIDGGTAQVNGTQIAWFAQGPTNGIPIVCAHSLFFDHTMFDRLAVLLSADGFRVITYDHRGQGASARATREQLSLDTLAADAAALITYLDLAPCHFIGNSLGGMVALRLAARRPELLRTAVACGASAEQEYRLDEFTPLIDHLTAHGPADVLDTLAHIMFGDTSLAASDSDMVTTWRAHMSRLEPSIGDAGHGVIHRPRIVEELTECKVPVLAIAGEQDHAYAPPISSVHIAAAAGGRSVVVEGAGHSVALEDPEACYKHITEHFARHAPADNARDAQAQV